MNILLTNDDGYRADGINFLKDYFTELNHNVYIIAPDREKSGASHSITLRDSIRLVKQKEKLWALKGTPADCVLVGLVGIIKEKIDVVISGVNHGPNIGRDILYSGTAAGAREGGFFGIPSIALSIDSWTSPYLMDAVKKFLDDHFMKLYENCDKYYFFNINFPNLLPDKIKGIKKTMPCHKHHYENQVVHYDSPFQGRYYWMNGIHSDYELDEGTDAKAVKDGYISVSLVKVFPEAKEIKCEF